MIRFFDDNGTDIGEATQRKIERLFYREDFRRALAAEIGDIEFPARALEYYTASLMRTVEAESIRSAGFKVVLNSSSCEAHGNIFRTTIPIGGTLTDLVERQADWVVPRRPISNRKSSLA